MFGIRGFISRHFGALKDAFKWIKNQENQEAVAKEIGTLLNLTKIAAPVVQTISGLIAGQEGIVATTDVLNAANRIGVKLEDVLNEPDKHRKAGLLLDLAGNGVRERLKTLLPTFDHGLEIDGRLIETVEELDALPNEVFHSIAQPTLRILRTVDDVGQVVVDAIEAT